MRPDFIISQRPSASGMVYIVVPTHTGAQNWMFAHVEPTERRTMSAHLSESRLAVFKGDAGVESMTFAEPGSPQPAGGGRN